MATAQQDRTQQEKGHEMASPSEVAALRTIRETVENAAGKVFGEPIHQDGMTVLPVAAVATGGGGGGGSGAAGSRKSAGTDANGEGGGFGVLAKPAGAFVIKDGAVTWRPAIDLNRVVMGGQVVAVVALLVLRGIVKARAKRKRQKVRMARAERAHRMHLAGRAARAARMARRHR